MVHARWSSFLVRCASFVAVAAAAAAAPEATQPVTEMGTLGGASYRIDIPANWNRNLVVFYHGYATTPVIFSVGEKLSPMFDPMLKQGYAVIQSGYSAGGWAVEQAYADTEKLRRSFAAKNGAPGKSYVLGMSMGGTLVAMTIEQRPEVYNGALSLCGAIEPSNRLMQRDFALRAAFDYYFPGMLGTLVPAPEEQTPEQEARIAAALVSRPAAQQALLHWYGAADADNLVAVIAFAGYEIRELQQRAHGNPFGNADLVYVGSGDDFALNDGVRRYRAEPEAAAYLARWYTPTGRLTRPLLALHDTGDPLVPAPGAFEYALAAERAGHGDNFVQQFVNREGHCVFTPGEIGHAFDELVAWTQSGKRPESGKLK
ncbi:MAG: alpha/beta hydrolase [Rudaea sp.]|nr:alpha/beta hydrolase [Rudaea sp.]